MRLFNCILAYEDYIDLHAYLQVLHVWTRKMGDMTVKTFTKHVVEWVEAGFIDKNVWRVFGTKVLPHDWPLDVSVEVEDTELQCKTL